MDSTELRKLGRIPYPLIRRSGERSSAASVWDEALDAIARKIRRIDPKQLAFYLTARGITNESYYAAAKVSAFARHEQYRQRLADLPLSVQDRA